MDKLKAFLISLGVILAGILLFIAFFSSSIIDVLEIFSSYNSNERIEKSIIITDSLKVKEKFIAGRVEINNSTISINNDTVSYSSYSALNYEGLHLNSDLKDDLISLSAHGIMFSKKIKNDIKPYKLIKWEDILAKDSIKITK